MKSINHVHAENYYKSYYDYLFCIADIKNKIFNQLKLIKLVNEINNDDKSLSKLFFSKYKYASIYVEGLFAFYILPTKCSLFFEKLNINADIVYNCEKDNFYLIRKNKKININLGNLSQATEKISNFKELIESIKGR